VTASFPAAFSRVTEGFNNHVVDEPSLRHHVFLLTSQKEDMMTPRKARKAALYLRTSHSDRAGWSVVAVYEDNGISGAKGRDGRPGFDQMLKDANRREFDVIMAWSVDRLGRSLQHLVGFLEEVHALGVDLYLHVQGVDTTTPAGKALFQMLGVFAEFERAMIRERVMAGLARAKAQGKAIGRPKVNGQIEKKVRALRAEGKGIKRVAKEAGVAVGTVYRILETAA
jgi:DNA invertase Pin-like site-specific DNA recombinase